MVHENASTNILNSLCCCSTTLRWSLCTGFGSTLLHSTDTCEDLTQSSEVEESSLGHGEQLAQEHQERHRGEDHGQDHQDLHRLQPLWKKKPPPPSFSCGSVTQGWDFPEVFFVFTSFFGGRAKPSSCEVVKPAVVPQVRVLPTSPLPPGLRREVRHDAADALLRIHVTGRTLPSPWWLWTASPGWPDAAGSRTWAGTPFSAPCEEHEDAQEAKKEVDSSFCPLFLFCHRTQTGEKQMTVQSVPHSGRAPADFFFFPWDFFRLECVDHHTTTSQKS